MGPNLIRRSTGLAQHLSKGFLSDENVVEVSSLEYDEDGSRSPINAYPFQDVLSGELVYHFEGREDFNPTRELQFRYHTESGLFVIHSDSTPPELEAVISRINDSLPHECRINKIRTIDRESLIRFFEQADQISHAQFAGLNQSSSLDELSLQTVNEGSVSGTEMKIVTAGGEERSYSLSNYPVKTVKGVFKRDGTDEPIIVEYSKGEFVLPYAKWGTFDRVLQLIEKELISSEL